MLANKLMLVSFVRLCVGLLTRNSYCELFVRLCKVLNPVRLKYCSTIRLYSIASAQDFNLAQAQAIVEVRRELHRCP